MANPSDRRAAMVPFTVLGVLAIIAGGVLAARIAVRPAPVLVWLVAYLVLVVGVAQYALGAWQARLVPRAPGLAFIAAQWLLFNLGNAGVIAGTVTGAFPLVFAGSLLVAAAMLDFAYAGVGSHGRPLWLAAYYCLVTLIFVSAIVGIVLARH